MQLGVVRQETCPVLIDGGLHWMPVYSRFCSFSQNSLVRIFLGPVVSVLFFLNQACVSRCVFPAGVSNSPAFFFSGSWIVRFFVAENWAVACFFLRGFAAVLSLYKSLPIFFPLCCCHSFFLLLTRQGGVSGMLSLKYIYSQYHSPDGRYTSVDRTVVGGSCSFGELQYQPALKKSGYNKLGLNLPPGNCAQLVAL